MERHFIKTNLFFSFSSLERLVDKTTWLSRVSLTQSADSTVPTRFMAHAKPFADVCTENSCLISSSSLFCKGDMGMGLVCLFGEGARAHSIASNTRKKKKRENHKCVTIGFFVTDITRSHYIIS